MYDLFHPSGMVLKEIARRILKSIGIRNIVVDGDCELDNFDIPLYPDVRRVLRLDWGNKVRRSLLHNCNGEMSSTEYYRTYVYWNQK